jgi:hypothetical protein
MIPAALDCIYSDSQITVHHLREANPGQEIYNFDHARSELCLNSSQPGYELSRDRHTEAGNFFIIVPNNPNPADEHYMLCPLFQFSHSACITVNADGIKVDHHALVTQYPGLLDVFRLPDFTNATIGWPMVFLHVPQSCQQHCIDLIRWRYAQPLTDQAIHSWQLQLQLKMPSQWQHDDWPLAYRLSIAFRKDLGLGLDMLTATINADIDQHNVDFLIERKRIIRQHVESWLAHSITGRLLQGMKIKQDSRADVTQHVVITHLVDCLDSALADTIRTVVLEHHKEYTEIV